MHAYRQPPKVGHTFELAIDDVKSSAEHLIVAHGALSSDCRLIMVDRTRSTHGALGIGRKRANTLRARREPNAGSARDRRS